MTRLYAEEPCEHGESKPGECDHIPTDRRAGGCIRLDCNVLHAVPCPGGVRRELTIDYEAARAAFVSFADDFGDADDATEAIVHAALGNPE